MVLVPFQLTVVVAVVVRETRWTKEYTRASRQRAEDRPVVVHIGQFLILLGGDSGESSQAVLDRSVLGYRSRGYQAVLFFVG